MSDFRYEMRNGRQVRVAEDILIEILATLRRIEEKMGMPGAEGQRAGEEWRVAALRSTRCEVDHSFGRNGGTCCLAAAVERARQP